MNKTAVFSLDIEDWYHLDYFEDMPGSDYSMLDGIEVYRNLLAKHDIPSSYFVLGELMEPLADTLGQLSAEGADIGVHGWNHRRPLTMAASEFKADIGAAKDLLEKTTGKPVLGYRAPCYSLDRERLEIIKDLGFKYDSSRIDFSNHPLYGSLEIDDFGSPAPFIYRTGDFFEFEVSTLPFIGRRVPVSGGGYLRIFPWFLMRSLLKRFVAGSSFYTLYIHPFELSRKKPPDTGKSISPLTRFRFRRGLGGVEKKLERLIYLLKDEGFVFNTFAGLRRSLL